MTEPSEQSGIFRAATDPDAEELPRPTADESDEAMRRLRHPFDVPGGRSRQGRGPAPSTPGH
jgi:hypothetical protein